MRSGQGSLNVNSKLFTDDILESNILGPYFEMMEAYKEFLSTLSSEQLCCLSNTVGFFIILVVIHSITTTLLGNKIISYFNLENKYPKISKYLKYREKMGNYYIIFSMFMIYLVSIYYICLNLYMFFSY